MPMMTPQSRADSKIGKAILAAGGGKSGIEMCMWWDAASKQLVPLERLVADEILKAVRIATLNLRAVTATEQRERNC